MFEDKNNYYVVMELVDGIDLFEFLHSCKVTDLDSKSLFVKKIAFEVLSALRDYESLSLVHKDLKLENVVLTDSSVLGGEDATAGSPGKAGSSSGNGSSGKGKTRGVLKIIDFDTVEHFDDTTQSYDVMGTDQYIAPEAYQGFYTTGTLLRTPKGAPIRRSYGTYTCVSEQRRECLVPEKK